MLTGDRGSAAPAGKGDAVRLESVRKVYGTQENPVVALAGLTAAFEHGSFTAVMGPSGSGKSTLLHCAAGLDRPSSGTVTLDGQDLGALTENQLTVLRRDRIGFVFQAFNLLPALTVTQNVTLPLRLAGRKADRAQVEQAIQSVGLSDRRNHRPHELSGGQQQRVAIARALVTRPSVLFADEPTGALDTHTGREILGLIRTSADHGQAVVMVTHDPVAAAFADRVLFLADGRLSGDLIAPDAETVAERLAQLGTPGTTIPVGGA